MVILRGFDESASVSVVDNGPNIEGSLTDGIIISRNVGYKCVVVIVSAFSC
jgi:hypothetical protein